MPKPSRFFKKKTSPTLLLLTAMALLAACARPGDPQPPPQNPEGVRPPPVFQGQGNYSALIFDGDSAWNAEVDSLASTLADHQISYEEADSKRLDAMTLEELAAYTLLIVPGGYAPTITDSLSEQSHEKLREAVQLRGLNYLGFCAGAWLAVAPAPAPGKDVSYGIGFVDGPLLHENYLEKQGYEFKIVPAAFPGGAKRDLLWYGGPVTPEIPGGVVARYPDGTPAISQMTSGAGFVTLSGLHPTANAAILNALGLSDSQAIAPDLTWKMLRSSLRREPLPSY